ncbi:MAG TPA: Arm DNA-binding domain-containing protein, partial [Rhodanobacter sp.]|nr:Arm DNA-binding domain-containing protein [Rhodanobacter sp.]
MLTDAKLRALKPRANAYRVADTNGLCLEVRSTGSKVWRYRFRHVGKASIITLGEYPTMSLAEARGGRDQARAQVRDGANPAHIAKANRATRLERANNTFVSVALEFLAKRETEG